MPSTCINLLYHIVFSTKKRLPLITPQVRCELYRYIGGIIQGENGILLAAGGMPDHIHLAFKIKASYSVSDILRKIKANSSKWMNEKLQHHSKFQWQRGYGAFSVSSSQLKGVIHYIQNQEEHHRRKSFKEEFIEFLEKQNIMYEEKYLWD